MESNFEQTADELSEELAKPRQDTTREQIDEALETLRAGVWAISAARASLTKTDTVARELLAFAGYSMTTTITHVKNAKLALGDNDESAKTGNT